MKVQVILYGTLRNGFSGHDPTHGLEVELAEGSRVGDLVDQLEISRTRLGVVTVDGIPVKADARLKERDCVRVFQPIAGG